VIYCMCIHSYFIQPELDPALDQTVANMKALLAGVNIYTLRDHKQMSKCQTEKLAKRHGRCINKGMLPKTKVYASTKRNK
jgi:hypothetical protein